MRVLYLSLFEWITSRERKQSDRRLLPAQEVLIFVVAPMILPGKEVLCCLVAQRFS